MIALNSTKFEGLEAAVVAKSIQVAIEAVAPVIVLVGTDPLGDDLHLWNELSAWRRRGEDILVTT